MHARQRTDAAMAPSPGVTDLVPERAGTGLTSRRCVSPRCRRDADTGTSQPRLAAARSLLCGHCRDRLDQQLRNLPDLYAELEQSINASRRRTPGVPLSPRTVEVRAAVRAVLASWAQLVVAERKVTRPVRNVVGMAEFLRRHLEWLGAHPAAAEIAGEVGEVVTAATQLSHADASWQAVVGKCSA